MKTYKDHLISHITTSVILEPEAAASLAEFLEMEIFFLIYLF